VKKLIKIPKPIIRETQPDWTVPDVSTGTFTCTSNIFGKRKDAVPRGQIFTYTEDMRNCGNAILGVKKQQTG